MARINNGVVLIRICVGDAIFERGCTVSAIPCMLVGWEQETEAIAAHKAASSEQRAIRGILSRFVSPQAG